LTFLLCSRSQPCGAFASMLNAGKEGDMDPRQRLVKEDADRAAEQRSRSLRLFFAQWAKRHWPDRVQFRRRRAS
jgi:hypothetical protein